jgi:hypothetical protein
MQELVQQAREVRRLIREVSLDSDASDLSLADFGLHGGGEALSRILAGTEDILRKSSPDLERESRSAESDSVSGGPLRRDESSCPDIAGLRSMRRSSQSIWRLTHFPSYHNNNYNNSTFSRHGSIASNASSLLEWESPLHNPQLSWHDVRPLKR